MSILSKIFIVLLVVLSIATSVSVIIIQRDVLQPKAELRDLAQRHQEVTLAKAKTAGDVNREQDEMRAKLSDLQLQARTKDESIKTLADQNKGLTQRLADADLRAQNFQADVRHWTTMATNAQEEYKAAAGKAEDYRGKYEKAAKDYTDLQVKVTQINADNGFLFQQVRVLKEQIVVLQDQLKSMQAGSTTVMAAGADTIAASAAPTVKGEVLKVAADMTMATINVGTNDGVQPDMTFDVFRGRDFLCELVVMQVHPKMAVGRLQKVQNRIQIGDQVSNNIKAN